MSHDSKSPSQRLDSALAQAPIIAILRGLTPEDALPVVQALFDAGIRVAEVPLNSPRPFESIRRLVEHFGNRMVLGAGTVTDVHQVGELAASGATLCVAPNTNPDVIAEAKRMGLIPMPGFQTASEAFIAITAGAHDLKLFPAANRISDLSALKAVLPKDVRLIAVGGVTPQNLVSILAAGATAVGVGSDLYRPGNSASEVRVRAEAWMNAYSLAGATPLLTMVTHPASLIGEAPLWNPSTQTIHWVDPIQRKLNVYHTAVRKSSELTLDAGISSIVTLNGGEMVGCLEDGLGLIDLTSGYIRRGPKSEMGNGCRFNDMTKDSRGGLWVGAMHKGLLATRGALYYAANLETPCVQVASGLGVPNGMVFSNDGHTLFVIDTLARTLLAYPANIELGELGEPVIVTDFMGIPGKPDGMTLARDGSPWVAMWGGGCVVKIGPNGALEEQIDIPAPHVSSLCFSDDGTLWVSTSRMRLSARQLNDSPCSGALFSITFRNRVAA